MKSHSANKKFTCPICTYPLLTEPFENFEICPSCGTQADYEDATPLNRQLRRMKLRLQWVNKGCPWFNHEVTIPAFWPMHVKRLARTSLKTLAGLQVPIQ